ncbi:dihydrodipicolinate synthase family protein [candidate division KSB1 bacterium]|nr:dihydrodipicolinate synthase family protein [candidate division KSB1 bacterium]
MSIHKQKLSGVFAPVNTPFKNDDLQLDDLRFNLKKYQKSPLKGYLALGSNGEFKSLSEDEQLKILQVFAEEKGEKTVMVGTARESTKHTIRMSNLAAGMGFEYVSILTPHYFAKQMDTAKLVAYYTRIADNIQVPLLIYNAPGFAGGVNLSVDAVLELAQHENIVGMKDTSPTGPGRFLCRLEKNTDFYILAGSVSYFYATLHLGAYGGVISLANFVPGACCELYDLFTQGKYGLAQKLGFKLQVLSDFISGKYGVAGVKAAMNLKGLKGGEPRHPLLPLTEKEIDVIKTALQNAGL